MIVLLLIDGHSLVGIADPLLRRASAEFVQTLVHHAILGLD